MSRLTRFALIALAALGSAALLIGLYGLVAGDHHLALLIGVGGSLVAVASLLSQRLARTTPDAR